MRRTRKDYYLGPECENPPEAEPINFPLNIENEPEDVKRVIFRIREVAKRFVYRWAKFPIVLPNYVYISDLNANHHGQLLHTDYNCEGYKIRASNSRSMVNKSVNKCSPRPVIVRDLFSCGPVFDELDAVAVDSHGEPHSLNLKQLESLRHTGRFDVSSINFPGQVHTWKVSTLLQKGREATEDSLANDIALALQFVIIIAVDRFKSPKLSMYESAKSFARGLLKLLDLAIGLPSLETQNLDMKIRDERSRYLVAELTCRNELENAMAQLCSYVKKQLRRAKKEKFTIWKDSVPISLPIPYIFYTPKNVEIDLRLFNRWTLRQGTIILLEIVRRETRGWFLHYREKLISDFRAQKVPEKEIEKEVNEAVTKEYLKRVYNSILSNADMAALGVGIPQLFVHQAQSTLIMNKAVENATSKICQELNREKECLIYENPLLSRIEQWLNKKVEKIRHRLNEQRKWDAHEEAISLCLIYHLYQTAYFLQRDLTFMRERESVLRKELRNVKIATRSFHWVTQIWFPSNWTIERSFQGHTEIIPTALSGTATSITVPRSDPQQAVFLVKKTVSRMTTTSWPFWRGVNYFHRTWSWMWNIMFFFGIIVPWCSPVSLRALFYQDPFYPDYELSQVNGTLFPRRSSYTPTLCSRLQDLWVHISKSRTKFESQPDTGFMGKGMTRQMNRFWNYIVKGLFGTLALLLAFPVVSVMATMCSLIMAFTAVIWVPLVTLTLHLSMGLIYDLDSAFISKNRYCVAFEALFMNIALRGVIQAVVCFFIGAVICPLVAMCIIMGAIVRYWARIAWDAAIFHWLIKKRGRIPSCDGFFASRISGPGFGSEYYLQISAEQAIAAFEAKLEYDELIAYKIQMEDLARQPLVDYKKFVHTVFGPFSAQASKLGVTAMLEKEAQTNISALNEKIDYRLKYLETGLSPTVASKIKLYGDELKVAIQQSARMLEKFYGRYVMSRLTVGEDEYWETRGLAKYDYIALASQMFTQIFTCDFVVPLHDMDTTYQLKPEPHVDLTRFTNILKSERVRENCPDLLGSVYTPQRNIHINSPRLDVSAFSPGPNYKLKVDIINAGITIKPYYVDSADDTGSRMKHLFKRRKGENRECENKLVVPLLIPHPAQITIIIHNRDAEDSIPLDCPLFKDIIKAIEGRTEESAADCYAVGTSSEDSASDSRLSNGDEGCASPIGNEAGPNAAFACCIAEQSPIERTRGQYERPGNEGNGGDRADLASPEDITLDSESSRLDFTSYTTTV